MFCQRCGAENPNEGRFCIQCGNALQGLAGSAPAAPSPSGAAVTSGKAIGSLICGILFFIPFVSIAAIVLGHLSLSEIRKSAGRVTGQGLAVVGLVLGYVGLLPMFLIVAAIAIPNLLRARMAANEASAVGSLRTIEVAAETYATTYRNGFPPGLDALGGTGGGNCDHAALIDSVLASGQKTGYVFTYTPRDPLPSVPREAKGCTIPGANGFILNADPVTMGATGGRGFYTDQTGAIRQQVNGIATAESPPLR